MEKLKEALSRVKERGTSIAILQAGDALALQEKIEIMIKALKDARDNCDSPHACSTIIDSALETLGIERD